MGFLQNSGATVRYVEVSGHGEQPRSEARVLAKKPDSRHEAQPCFFEQILRDLTISGETHQEVVEARIECGVDFIKSRCLGAPQPTNQFEFEIPLHITYNALTHVL